MKIFITRLLPEEGLQLLRQEADVRVWPEELPPPYEILKKEAQDSDGLVSLLTDRIDAALLENCPKLKIISNYAVGYDNIDIAAASKKSIMVTNTPGVLTETTADLAFALMMSCARRITESQAYVKAGHWKTWGPTLLLGRDLYGATLGLIGLGRIGAAVARRARGFDMKILYYSRTRQEQLEKEFGLTYAGLEEVLKEADFLSIHVPLTEHTRGLINKDSLRLMKKTAVLINTARGPIINEADLYMALKEKSIWAAGLDVTDPEPMLPDNPLLTLDNCLVAPHIGSASVATRTKMSVMVAENILAGLKGERPANLVNTELFANRL
ncbi:MAG: D-glycerate dehydrogenase [Clostridia bacterium]|jgi:glyoxylate reductase|nr:D-glycerate dehydrogenase [Clostridia bacterium]